MAYLREYKEPREDIPRNQFIITYDEAQSVIPKLQDLIDAKDTPIGMRRAASNLMHELENVRKDVQYGLGGKQVFLTDAQARLFQTLRGSAGNLGKAAAVMVPAALAGLAAIYFRRE